MSYFIFLYQQKKGALLKFSLPIRCIVTYSLFKLNKKSKKFFFLFSIKTWNHRYFKKEINTFTLIGIICAIMHTNNTFFSLSTYKIKNGDLFTILSDLNTDNIENLWCNFKHTDPAKYNLIISFISLLVDIYAIILSTNKKKKMYIIVWNNFR